jgi:hypothetical protein
MVGSPTTGCMRTKTVSQYHKMTRYAGLFVTAGCNALSGGPAFPDAPKPADNLDQANARVQAARSLVHLGVELAAGMERAHDHFEGGLPERHRCRTEPDLDRPILGSGYDAPRLDREGVDAGGTPVFPLPVLHGRASLTGHEARRQKLTRSCPRPSTCFALRNLYSITSSALSRIDCGTVRPSALAVLRLTAISDFVAN